MQVPCCDMAAMYDRPWRKVAAELTAQIKEGRWRPGDRLPTYAQLAETHGVAKGTIRNAIAHLQKNGLVDPRGGSGIYVLGQEDSFVPEPADHPEHQPVVAAIVTSHKGVLAGRRRDGKPPWTFIAGEIEPGESQIDAAVREVKEEAGIRVRAGQVELGRRVHPKTGRLMIYLACSPIDSPDAVFVGDEEELSDVRWLSLAEVDSLMPQVFEPVREHLTKVIA